MPPVCLMDELRIDDGTESAETLREAEAPSRIVLENDKGVHEVIEYDGEEKESSVNDGHDTEDMGIDESPVPAENASIQVEADSGDEGGTEPSDEASMSDEASESSNGVDYGGYGSSYAVDLSGIDTVGSEEFASEMADLRRMINELSEKDRELLQRDFGEVGRSLSENNLLVDRLVDLHHNTDGILYAQGVFTALVVGVLIANIISRWFPHE